MGNRPGPFCAIGRGTQAHPSRPGGSPGSTGAAPGARRLIFIAKPQGKVLRPLGVIPEIVFMRRAIFIIILLSLFLGFGWAAYQGWIYRPHRRRPRFRLAAGHQEVAWFAPATSGDSWERLVAALKSLEKDWTTVHADLPPLKVSFTMLSSSKPRRCRRSPCISPVSTPPSCGSAGTSLAARSAVSSGSRSCKSGAGRRWRSSAAIQRSGPQHRQ